MEDDKRSYYLSAKYFTLIVVASPLFPLTMFSDFLSFIMLLECNPSMFTLSHVSAYVVCVSRPLIHSVRAS